MTIGTNSGKTIMNPTFLLNFLSAYRKTRGAKNTRETENEIENVLDSVKPTSHTPRLETLSVSLLINSHTSTANRMSNWEGKDKSSVWSFDIVNPYVISRHARCHSYTVSNDIIHARKQTSIFVIKMSEPISRYYNGSRLRESAKSLKSREE
jgi:hypothetical protein